MEGMEREASKRGPGLSSGQTEWLETLQKTWAARGDEEERIKGEMRGE